MNDNSFTKVTGEKVSVPSLNLSFYFDRQEQIWKEYYTYSKKAPEVFRDVFYCPLAEWRYRDGKVLYIPVDRGRDCIGIYGFVPSKHIFELLAMGKNKTHILTKCAELAQRYI